MSQEQFKPSVIVRVDCRTVHAKELASLELPSGAYSVSWWGNKDGDVMFVQACPRSGKCMPDQALSKESVEFAKRVTGMLNLPSDNRPHLIAIIPAQDFEPLHPETKEMAE